MNRKPTLERIKQRAEIDALFEYRQDQQHGSMEVDKMPCIGRCIKTLVKMGVHIDSASTDPAQSVIDALDAYCSQFRYTYRTVAHACGSV